MTTLIDPPTSITYNLAAVILEPKRKITALKSLANSSHYFLQHALLKV
jgi:hypothetical protein